MAVMHLPPRQGVHMFIENFQRMKFKNLSYYFAYEMNDRSRLKHVFGQIALEEKIIAIW